MNFNDQFASLNICLKKKFTFLPRTLCHSRQVPAVFKWTLQCFLYPDVDATQKEGIEVFCSFIKSPYEKTVLANYLENNP